MYAGSMAGGNITCDYIGWTGHIRPCLPGMCREAGVFTTKVNNEKHPNQMSFKRDTVTKVTGRDALSAGDCEYLKGVKND